MDYELDFNGGAGGFVENGGDVLEQSGVTMPLFDDNGAGLANLGKGPAFAWVGFVILLVLLRLLIEVSDKD